MVLATESMAYAFVSQDGCTTTTTVATSGTHACRGTHAYTREFVLHTLAVPVLPFNVHVRTTTLAINVRHCLH